MGNAIHGFSCWNLSIGDWNFLHIFESAPCQEMPLFTLCMESIFVMSKYTSKYGK